MTTTITHEARIAELNATFNSLTAEAKILVEDKQALTRMYLGVRQSYSACSEALQIFARETLGRIESDLKRVEQRKAEIVAILNQLFEDFFMADMEAMSHDEQQKSGDKIYNDSMDAKKKLVDRLFRFW